MRKWLKTTAAFLLMLCLMTVSLAPAETKVVPFTGTEAMTADFSAYTGVPLFKRQNVFSPSHSFVGSYAAEFVRDAVLLKDLRSENMRVDLFMGNGGIGGALGTGDENNISMAFMALDLSLKQFYKNGCLPYLVYFATPNALYDKQCAYSNYWKYPPKDLEKWGEICGEIAAHYAAKSWPLAANEIWNEPDWFDYSTNSMAFYGGTWEEYLQIYKYAALGIRKANPYANVGGLSLATFSTAVEDGKVHEFLEFVEEEELPLDFISYHSYVLGDFQTYTKLANLALAKYGDTFSSVGLNLNEFNVSMSEGTTATEKAVSPMMDALCYFIDTPQITSVNWACFRVASEKGIQMIESRTGKRYAAYHLLSFYNDMPVDRVSLTTANGIQGFASVDADAGRAGVMLYNRTYKEKSASLALENLPFDLCDITVYAIDEQHSNYGRNGGSDEADIIYSETGVCTEKLSYEITLPTNGLVYIKITESGSNYKAEPVTELVNDIVINGGVATVLRKEYYFEDRNTTAFSEFDLGTFTAYAGTGDAKKGLTMGKVVLSNLPDALSAVPVLLKNTDKETNAFLLVRYENEAGEVLSEICYKTGKLPDIVSAETQMAELNIGEKLVLTTPENFDGVLIMTYGLIDAGTDQTLKIPFEKE